MERNKIQTLGKSLELTQREGFHSRWRDRIYKSGEIKIPSSGENKPFPGRGTLPPSRERSCLASSCSYPRVDTTGPRDDGSCHVPANWPRRAQEPRIRISPSGHARNFHREKVDDHHCHAFVGFVRDRVMVTQPLVKNKCRLL